MNAQTVITTEQPASIHPVTPFQRGQEVVCKPGVFAYESGIGEVKDIIDGTVIVYFESIKHATICTPRDLELAPTPLLDLYPGVDASDMLSAVLDPNDTIELIGVGDNVLWDFAACAEPREGVIVQTRPNLDYALVEFQFGTQRWCHINEIKLVLKASAWLITETLQSEDQSAQ